MRSLPSSLCFSLSMKTPKIENRSAAWHGLTVLSTAIVVNDTSSIVGKGLRYALLGATGTGSLVLISCVLVLQYCTCCCIRVSSVGGPNNQELLERFWNSCISTLIIYLSVATSSPDLLPLCNCCSVCIQHPVNCIIFPQFDTRPCDEFPFLIGKIEEVHSYPFVFLVSPWCFPWIHPGCVCYYCHCCRRLC